MHSKSASALSLSYTNKREANSSSSCVLNTENSEILPDLSHLSEEERQIIASVLERQRAEELGFSSETKRNNAFAKNSQAIKFEQTNPVKLSQTVTTSASSSTPIKYSTLPSQNNKQPQSNQLHQCHSISDIADQVKQRYGSIDTGNLCDICKKTKFAYSGAGHICFSCKLRCCIRCAFKYTTKTKQIWTCVECKKKQDTLLRSGKWLNESNNNLKKKSYTSDYILNKAAEAGIMTLPTDKNNNTSKMNNSNNSEEISSNTAIKSSQRRVLPTITKQKSIQINMISNIRNLSVDVFQVEDKEKESLQTINAQPINQITSSSIDTNTPNKNNSVRLKHPLLKQASLNNPPTYSTNTSQPYGQTSENTSYHPNKNLSKLYTSNQDFGKVSSNLQNEQSSSPNSSNYQFNSPSRNRERLQDPTQLFKSIQKGSNPGSRLNSVNNISELADEDLFSIEKRNSLSKLNDSSNQLRQNHQSTTKQTITSSPVIIQRSKQQQLLHADSLSSDPSDYQRTSNQLEFKPTLEEMSRKHSKTKRNNRSRKQPPIPISNMMPPQQLLQRALMKHNLKQHSLTSSDDDIIHNTCNKNPRKSAYQEEEDEEDIDDEIRSTTEMSTNDEMDLESGSVNVHDQNLLKNQTISMQSKIDPVLKQNLMLNKINRNSNLAPDYDSKDQLKTIDDYLVQNLKKDEILAAKMSKFLSPTNWQLSSDGKKLIGSLILKHDPNMVKSSSTSTMDSSNEFSICSSLGLKIIGGRANPLLSNQLCTYVVKIRKDSIADSIGRLQVDDEIVKWNGKLLRGLTYDEVYSIVSNSQQDFSQIDLVVERIVDDSDRLKFKGLLWNNEPNSVSDVDLKFSQQQPNLNQQADNTVSFKNDSNADNNNQNKPIGKLQLKIFHDSIEQILYINVLNISLNNISQHELPTIDTNDTLFNISNINNNNNNNNDYIKNEVESIYCLLHLLLKKRNLEQFKKLSEVCTLDKTTGLFLINEAFTFEPVNSIDLPQLNLELQAINYLTKETLGKLTIEYSEEMFDNQIINLNMLPISNNQTNTNKSLQQQQGHSPADNSQNSRRRQLPQLPFAKPPDNAEKGAVDMTEKARRIKLELRPDKTSVSDGESMKMTSPNQFNNSNEQSSSLFANQPTAQFESQLNQIQTQHHTINNNRTLPKQYSDKSDYSNENDEYLFNNNNNNNIKNTINNNYTSNNNNNTFHQDQQQHQHKKQQPVVPLQRSRLRDASQLNPTKLLSNNFNSNTINDEQSLFGQNQPDTAQNVPFNRRNVNNINNLMEDNGFGLNGDVNESSSFYNNNKTNTKMIQNEPNRHLRRQETPPSPLSSSPPPSSSTAVVLPPPTRPTPQRQLPKPVKSQRQLPQPLAKPVRPVNTNTSSSFLPQQEWPESVSDSPANTKKPDRLIESTNKSLLLDLKNKTSDLYASNNSSSLYNNNNNISNINSSYLSQSPDNFVNNNINSNKQLPQPPLNKSPFKQNSFDYPNEFTRINALDNNQQFANPNNNPTNTQGGTPPRRAEKLFSARHLNQRVFANNNNNNNNNNTMTAIASPPTAAQHGHNNPVQRNGFEFDSDGSEHSQFSQVSKLSSTSVMSAQSELLKGANNQNRKNATIINNNNNNNSKIANNHDPNMNMNMNRGQPINTLQEQPNRLISETSNQKTEIINNTNINMNMNSLEQSSHPRRSDPHVPALAVETLPSLEATSEMAIAQTSNLKQTNNKTAEKPSSSVTAETSSTAVPPGSTSTKLSSNIPIPSYIKSKDNPTFDFFVQFSTPVKQTSKNNSTISLPGQSMQQTTQTGIVNAKETDGTLSDSALSNPNNPPENSANKKRRPSMAKALVILGLSKKSNSASNLTLGKRYGFARSEEIGAVPELRNLKLNSASMCDNSSAENSLKPRLWSGALKLPHEVPYSDFIEGLGPGQKISRQALGLPCLGEVKMSLFLEKQKLNIEIMQAKNLKIKIGYRVMPISVYIKLYMFNGTSCVEKQKTSSKRRTLNPTFQETLKFETNYRGTMLQMTCWGDYGKLDRKVFMGVAQIVLDELNLSNTIVGWYKLYSVSSIVTDFSTLTPATDLTGTESGYSLASK